MPDDHRRAFPRLPLRSHAHHDPRYPARRLRAVVLPSHRAGGHRRRTHAGVRHQQRRARHARGDLFLRLHAAADSGRRAGRYIGSACHRDGRSVGRWRGIAALRSCAVVGSGGGRPHARRHRCLGRVHRAAEDHRGLVSRPPLRDAERCRAVRRQPGRGDRGRAARVDRHGGVMADGVRRAGCPVHGARRRLLDHRARPAGTARLPAGARACRCHTAIAVGTHIVDACAGAGDGQSAHLAGVLRQSGHRRQLPGVRRAVGGAVPAAGVRHAAQRRRAARQPAAAGGRVGCARSSGRSPTACAIGAT